MSITAIPASNTTGTYPFVGKTDWLQYYVQMGANLSDGKSGSSVTVPGSYFMRSGPQLPYGHTTVKQVLVKVQWLAASGVTLSVTANGATFAGNGQVQTSQFYLTSADFPTTTATPPNSSAVNGYGWWKDIICSFISNGTVTPGTSETRTPSSGTDANGSYQITHADGTYTKYYSDGSSTTYSSGGQTISTTPATTTTAQPQAQQSQALQSDSGTSSNSSASSGTTSSGTTSSGSAGTTGGGTGTTTPTGTIYDMRVELQYQCDAGPTIFDPSTCTKFSLPLNYDRDNSIYYPWKSTGLTLAKDYTITVNASGSGTYDGYTVVTPNGLTAYDYPSGYSYLEMAPGRTPYSLVACILPVGQVPQYNALSSTTYQCGTGLTTITAAAGGVLWLGFNEINENGRQNNTGGFCIDVGAPTPPNTGPQITNTHARITGNAPATTANPCDTGYVVLTSTSNFYYGSYYTISDFTKSGPTLPSNAIIQNIDISWQYQGDKDAQGILSSTMGALTSTFSFGYNNHNTVGSSNVYTAHNPSRVHDITPDKINANAWFSDTISWQAASSNPATLSGMVCDVRIEVKFKVPCADSGTGGDGGSGSTTTTSGASFITFAPARRLWVTIPNGKVLEMEWDSAGDAYYAGDADGLLRDGGFEMPDGYWESQWMRGPRRRLASVAIDPPQANGYTVTLKVESIGKITTEVKAVLGRHERVGQKMVGTGHKMILTIKGGTPNVHSITKREHQLGPDLES